MSQTNPTTILTVAEADAFGYDLLPSFRKNPNLFLLIVEGDIVAWSPDRTDVEIALKAGW